MKLKGLRCFNRMIERTIRLWHHILALPRALGVSKLCTSSIPSSHQSAPFSRLSCISANVLCNYAKFSVFPPRALNSNDRQNFRQVWHVMCHSEALLSNTIDHWLGISPNALTLSYIFLDFPPFLFSRPDSIFACLKVYEYIGGGWQFWWLKDWLIGYVLKFLPAAAKLRRRYSNCLFSS